MFSVNIFRIAIHFCAEHDEIVHYVCIGNRYKLAGLCSVNIIYTINNKHVGARKQFECHRNNVGENGVDVFVYLSQKVQPNKA